MRRFSLDLLEKWKNKKDPLPLLIRGARQVGKTWLVRKHAEAYGNLLEINLESHPEYIKIFKDHYGKPDELLPALALLGDQKIEKGKTLLFIDEIQESKEALLSLRYLREKTPGLHVIAAGSLLEFTFKDLSFPVGRIDFFHLFPMNFEEYLLAQNRKDLIEAILKAGPKNPLPEAVHQKLLDEVTRYSLIGGMPEVVKTAVESRDLNECQNIQQRLVASFREDFHKYTSKTNIEYLRILFNEIPRLLGQKFKYSQVDSSIKSRELSEALNKLEMAGLAYKVCHSSANGLPLAAQIKPKKFKVFFLDVGLCHRILGLPLSQLYLKKKTLLANEGAVAKQLAAQELLSYTSANQSPQLYYWHRESKSSQAEVDLVIEQDSHVLPIEIKSGTGGSLKSLHLFLKEKEKWAEQALKISGNNFSRHENIESLPFYALMQLSRR